MLDLRVTLRQLYLLTGFVAFSAFGLMTPACGGLMFNLNSTGNAGADAGFLAAANYWSGQFTDNVQVNLSVGFTALNPGTLGQAGSSLQLFGFTQWRAAMAADATSADDASMVGGLPAGSAFSVYINRTSENSGLAYSDNDGGANNTTVALTTANAKALGLISPLAAAVDASITFSTLYNFDFDPTDGIAVGAIDFVGVAIHEIGHALGFVSGVDFLDGIAAQDGNVHPDDYYNVVTGLDFTRFSAASLAAGADLDWTADNRAKYFSIDGGLTAAAPGADHWSRGVYFGDGRQASHWRDNLGLGIMDPTAAPAGLAMSVTPLDLQALDVIGWNSAAASLSTASAPEPGAFAVLLLGSSGVLLYRRRRSATALSACSVTSASQSRHPR